MITYGKKPGQKVSSTINLGYTVSLIPNDIGNLEALKVLQQIGTGQENTTPGRNNSNSIRFPPQSSIELDKTSVAEPLKKRRIPEFYDDSKVSKQKLSPSNNEPGYSLSRTIQ
jgi:hypothetical protein